MRQKKNIPADPGHVFTAEIDSTDLKNENLTTKISRKTRYKKPYFF